MKTSFISLLLVAVLPLSAAVLKNDDFSKGLRGWNTPNYWAGKTRQIEENGKKYLLLESGVRNKTEIFGRALGYSKQIPYFPGDTVVIKIKAKGEGTLASGVLVYRFGIRGCASAPPRTMWRRFCSIRMCRWTEPTARCCWNSPRRCPTPHRPRL